LSGVRRWLGAAGIAILSFVFLWQLVEVACIGPVPRACSGDEMAAALALSILIAAPGIYVGNRFVFSRGRRTRLLGLLVAVSVSIPFALIAAGAVPPVRLVAVAFALDLGMGLSSLGPFYQRRFRRRWWIIAAGSFLIPAGAIAVFAMVAYKNPYPEQERLVLSGDVNASVDRSGRSVCGSGPYGSFSAGISDGNYTIILTLSRYRGPGTYLIGVTPTAGANQVAVKTMGREVRSWYSTSGTVTVSSSAAQVALGDLDANLAPFHGAIRPGTPASLHLSGHWSCQARQSPHLRPLYQRAKHIDTERIDTPRRPAHHAP